MGKVKKLLTNLERVKAKIAKFVIVCAALKFFSSTLYRIYDVQDSRTLLETMINLYSLLIMSMILLHEFIKCFLCRAITDNFKVITHYRGKGFVFILLSFIYMAPSLGTQQNYSGYLLFFSGLVLILIDLKFETEKTLSPYEMAIERSKNRSQKSGEMDCLESARETRESNAVEVDSPSKNCCKNNNESIGAIEIKIQTPSNPYDIPDDF